MRKNRTILFIILGLHQNWYCVPGIPDRNEYIIALVRAKNFKEAKEEIDRAKEINGEVFSKLSLIPLLATDHKCGKRQMRYEGAELEELLVAAMKKYDVNWVDPPKFPDIFPHEKTRNYNSYVERFIHQISIYAKESPFCLEKERVIRIIKLMLDNGLRPTHFNSQFAYIVSLDDIEFAKNILQSGVKIKREFYPSLFYHAKDMEMVRFLESQGFTLTPEEFKKILENNKKCPELLKDTNPQVIEYYQSKSK